jgi:hypothetical protein
VLGLLPFLGVLGFAHPGTLPRCPFSAQTPENRPPEERGYNLLDPVRFLLIIRNFFRHTFKGGENDIAFGKGSESQEDWDE